MIPTTIGDVESIVQSGLEALRNAPMSAEITLALKYLLPDGLRPVVHLGDKAQSSASDWNPETGAITIHFEPVTAEQVVADSVPPPKPLFEPHKKLDVVFRPVPIRGEPLSTTILRDRGEF